MKKLLSIILLITAIMFTSCKEDVAVRVQKNAEKKVQQLSYSFNSDNEGESSVKSGNVSDSTSSIGIKVLSTETWEEGGFLFTANLLDDNEVIGTKANPTQEVGASGVYTFYAYKNVEIKEQSITSDNKIFEVPTDAGTKYGIIFFSTVEDGGVPVAGSLTKDLANKEMIYEAKSNENLGYKVFDKGTMPSSNIIDEIIFTPVFAQLGLSVPRDLVGSIVTVNEVKLLGGAQEKATVRIKYNSEATSNIKVTYAQTNTDYEANLEPEISGDYTILKGNYHNFIPNGNESRMYLKMTTDAGKMMDKEFNMKDKKGNSIIFKQGRRYKLSIDNQTLESIAIEPSEATLIKGKETKLKLIATYSGGAKTDVTERAEWVSSKPAVATVSMVADTKGLVKAVEVGESTITAKFAGKEATAKVKVTNDVTEVRVTPNSAEIVKGNTIPLTAIAFYQDGTDKDVTKDANVNWESVAPGIASVEAKTGIVKGESEGSTKVRATYSGKTGEATVNVINDYVKRIYLSKTSTYNNPSPATSYSFEGFTGTWDAGLWAIVEYASGKVAHEHPIENIFPEGGFTWASSNPGAITVVSKPGNTEPGGSGWMQGISTGSSKITITLVSGGKTFTHSVDVQFNCTQDYVKRIYLSKTSADNNPSPATSHSFSGPGGTINGGLWGVVEYASGKVVSESPAGNVFPEGGFTWTSSNTKAIEVKSEPGKKLGYGLESGYMHGIWTGSSKITITLVSGGKTFTYSVDVQFNCTKDYVKKIYLSKTSEDNNPSPATSYSFEGFTGTWDASLWAIVEYASGKVAHEYPIKNIFPEGGFTWTSSNPKAVTVVSKPGNTEAYGSGWMQGISTGSSKITITLVSGGKTFTHSVDVQFNCTQDYVKRIYLSKTSADNNPSPATSHSFSGPGGTINGGLWGVVEYASGKVVSESPAGNVFPEGGFTWTSSNTKAIEVKSEPGKKLGYGLESGYMHGIWTGSSKITITLVSGGKTFTHSVDVQFNCTQDYVKRIYLSKTSADNNPSPITSHSFSGEGLTWNADLWAIAEYASGKVAHEYPIKNIFPEGGFTWTSSNPNAVTVVSKPGNTEPYGSGWMQGIWTGTSKITIKLGNLSYSANVQFNCTQDYIKKIYLTKDGYEKTPATSHYFEGEANPTVNGGLWGVAEYASGKKVVESPSTGQFPGGGFKWTSSDPSTIEVISMPGTTSNFGSGYMRGYKSGTVTLKITLGSLSYSVSVEFAKIRVITIADYCQWDAYESYEKPDYGNWGSGSSHYNPVHLPAKAATQKCANAADHQQCSMYMAAGVYWTTDGPPYKLPDGKVYRTGAWFKRKAYISGFDDYSGARPGGNGSVSVKNGNPPNRSQYFFVPAAGWYDAGTKKLILQGEKCAYWTNENMRDVNDYFNQAAYFAIDKVDANANSALRSHGLPVFYVY